jgi:CHAT domain-containing protein/Flp pilus assembly protein TadD
MATWLESFGDPRRLLVLVSCVVSALILLPMLSTAGDSPYEEAKELIISGGDLIKRKEIDKGISEMKKALPLAWESKDGYLVAITYRWLGLAYINKGNVDAGHDAFDAAITVLKQMGDVDELLFTLKIAVTVSHNHGIRQMEISYLYESAKIYALLEDFKAQADMLSQVLDVLVLPGDAELMRNVLLQLQQVYQKVDNQDGIASTWVGLGHCKELERDVEGAIDDYEKAIAIYRRTGNQDFLSKVLDKTAETLRHSGRYSQALPLQKEAVTVSRTLRDATAVAQSLNDLALLYQSLGDIPQAAKCIEESLVLTRKIGTKRNLATALTNMAAIYRDLGRFKEGFTLLEEVFKIVNEEGLVRERTSAGHILGTIFHAQGDPLGAAAAAAAAAAAEDLAQRDRSKTEPSIKDSHNLGISLIDLGKYEKAIEIFDRELKKAEAEKDAPGVASAHEGLAAAYAASGRDTTAESHLLETLRICRELQDSMGTASTLGNLANIYVAMGHYYDALDRFSEVIKIVDTLQAPRLQLETLLSISNIHRHLKNYDQAMVYAQGAFELSQKYGFAAVSKRAMKAQGLIYLHQGNFDHAERAFRDAAKEIEAKSLEVINEGLVEVYLATRRFQEAKEELSRVTPELLDGASPVYRLQYYTQRGIANLGLGLTQESVADFGQGVSHAEEMKAQHLFGKSLGFFDAGSYGGRARPYRGMIEALANLGLSGVEGTVQIGNKTYDLTAAALHYAEMMRGRYLGEKLAFSGYKEMRRKMPESLQEKEARLSTELMELNAEMASRKDRKEEITPEQVKRFAKLQDELKAHLALIKKEYPQYALFFSPSVISLEHLPLSEDEVVLEYAVGLNSVFLFVIKQGQGLRVIRLPVSIGDLEAQVRAFRDLIIAKRFSASFGNDLFKKLLGDALPHLKPKSALIVVPDGILGLLPFEALVMAHGVDNSPPTFLGAQHRVSYVQSTSIMALARNSTSRRAEKPFFALADPIFSSADPRYTKLQGQGASENTNTQKVGENSSLSASSRRVSHFHSYRRLPETQVEVETLASIMGTAPREPDVLTGNAANEATLRKVDLGAYRFIHFATHAALGEPGYVDEPFLVLGQVQNDVHQDGLLTMREIMEFELRSELVVLSACDTGRGDVFEGDGIASLASAFQFAGAETVVLSLWELPSKAALAYMEMFYRYLKKGHGKAKALQLSRVAMRRRYVDPYYWAVFVLYSGLRQ